MLLEFLLVITPGSGVMYFILRFIKRSNSSLTIARTDAARSQARLEAARQTSALMGETAREAMGQVTDALAIAKTIEDVDTNLRYVISRIDGQAPDRPTHGRHARALPSTNDLPAIGEGILP